MHRTPSRLGDYLRARRAVTQPEDVGLARDPTRRVSGLRREEVAQLAGISPDYYLRLEQGKARQPSEQVVTALVVALQLDRHAELYIRRLAIMRDAPSKSTPARLGRAEARLVSQIRGVGALLVDTNLDVLHSNSIATALIPRAAESPVNLIAELLRSSERSVRDRSRMVDTLVSVLRYIGAPNPRLQHMVGELSLTSPEFSSAWAKHDVREPGPLTAHIDVNGLGAITLECNMLMLASCQYAVVTIAGTDTPRGRASMQYLQELGDEILRAVRARDRGHV